MRKIGDLVITLENENREDTEIRTKKIDEARKNLGHWKEPKEIKNPKHFPVLVKTATETSQAIFTAGVKRAEAAMLYQGVFQLWLSDLIPVDKNAPRPHLQKGTFPFWLSSYRRHPGPGNQHQLYFSNRRATQTTRSAT